MYIYIYIPVFKRCVNTSSGGFPFQKHFEWLAIFGDTFFTNLQDADEDADAPWRSFPPVVKSFLSRWHWGRGYRLGGFDSILKKCDEICVYFFHCMLLGLLFLNHKISWGIVLLGFFVAKILPKSLPTGRLPDRHWLCDFAVNCWDFGELLVARTQPERVHTLQVGTNFSVSRNGEGVSGETTFFECETQNPKKVVNWTLQVFLLFKDSWT